MNLFFCGFGTLLATVGKLVSNIKTLNVNKLTFALMFTSEVSKFFRVSLPWTAASAFSLLLSLVNYHHEHKLSTSSNEFNKNFV